LQKNAIGRASIVIKKMRGVFIAVLLASTALFALVAWLNFADETAESAQFVSAPALVEKGRYLALAGNCAGCHTAPGGEPYAGGYGVPTPYGAIYAGNLTPNKQHGLGDWSANEFWRALHNGRSKSGRLLYPAFPYTNYTKVSRADSDALFAYLQSLPPQVTPNKNNELGFPYNTQAALGVWRALYFRPGVYEQKVTQPEDWNRGAYLVQGLGHCDACHAQRDKLGGVRGQNDSATTLKGGVIPMLNWYAPSLASVHAGKNTVIYLKIGRTQSAWASGPMAEVVFGSTQYLSDLDLKAMASYLNALPVDAPQVNSRPSASSDLGATIYKNNCESCHGKNGEGLEGAYPAMAGNHSVLLDQTASIVRMIVEGGFGAATAGNPRPYGMPPFGQSLSPLEIAAVMTHIRSSWGNQASFVSEIDVLRYR
jgi:mono/diheme cytochrome c family protein